ncbi:MAG: methyl-accepting chemotaxis protein [Sphingobium sp.]|uniref:methyl-accepting chemotaxis protein n=1 Tax=Sphingobium sp. TaxID=1912891 RepID=UPI0029BFA31E|nr:methyl-accepting chemotaxis protein [Sphingobium sp.]MDX3910508.1 methyl-accepting chemotaxis protein [Sphingobium sp.]
MQDILNLAFEVHRVTEEKIGVIDDLTRRTRTLSLNARIEATRAGDRGSAFAVVAQEMSDFAKEVAQLSTELRNAIGSNMARIETAGERMMLDFRGARFSDLSRNVVEIMDRNLYERSCDVRWWATDSAVVNAVEEKASTVERALAAKRLATILRSYTVYLDLWIVDLEGRIVTNGRGDRYPDLAGNDVSHEEWFRKALETQSGDDFAVCNITLNPLLENAAVATYSTAIRQEGDTYGAPIGVLGIFFDWQPQAQAVISNVALSEEEKSNSRVMLLDNDLRVIASSDGRGILTEKFKLKVAGQQHGFYLDGKRLVSYALTPGYETYSGLGWYGCIESTLALQHDLIDPNRAVMA